MKTPGQLLRQLWDDAERIMAGAGASPALRAPVASYFADRHEVLMACPLAMFSFTVFALFDHSWRMEDSRIMCWGAAATLGVWAGRRVLANDRSPTDWSLLFQRPGAPSAHFRRVLAVAAGTLALLLLLTLEPTTLIMACEWPWSDAVACAAVSLLVAFDFFAVTVGVQRAHDRAQPRLGGRLLGGELRLDSHIQL